MTSQRHHVLVVLMWEAGPMPESAIVLPLPPAVFFELEREGMIERQGDGWAITEKGRAHLTGSDWLY